MAPSDDVDTEVRRSQQHILVVSAAQTYRSVVDAIHRARPQWVVVVREEEWTAAPFMYAYRPDEILGMSGLNDLVLLRHALDLHEHGASRVQEEGSIATAAAAGAGAPPTQRVITINADGAPVGIDDRSGSVFAGGKLRAIARETGGTPFQTAPARDSIEMRLAAQAPAALNPGDDDIIEVTAAAASDGIDLKGSTDATGSASEPISVLISILGDAVVVTGTRIVRINPPAPGTPSQTAFEIHAVHEGAVQAAVLFRQGGSELGSIRLHIQVAQSATRRQSRGEVDGAPRVADDGSVLLLQVDKINAGPEIRYQYRVQCPRLGLDFAQFESPRLLAPDGTAAATEMAFVQRIYGTMTNRMLRSQSEVKRSAAEVEAFAEGLCEQLFPADLIHLLWEGREKIDCIRVMSWEPYIPWELVKLALPGEQKSDDRFLSQYGMVRWLNGGSATRELLLRDWSYYAATYPNNPADDVTKEIDYLTNELPKRNIQPTRVASTYDAFVSALQNAYFDVLHVACHGDVKEDNIEKAELVITDELVNGRPKYVSISANLVGKIARLWPRRPLVFLNACESGRMGESLTAWGGWPKKLIGAGAGAVVGASWPVRDVASAKFSTSFYDALLAGKSLATAASAARTAASTSGDATWVSFKVFGDPHAKQEDKSRL